MISQPSPNTEPPSVSVRPTRGTSLLRALLALSLAYYAVLVGDLILHPLAPGINLDGSVAVAFRYVEALIGTGVIVVGAFIMRRVPGNRVGPLLILWGVGGAASFATRENWGSPLLTSLMRLIYEFYGGSVAWPALLVLVVCFPTGQVYPHWAGRWVTLYVLLNVIAGIVPILAQGPGGAKTFGIPDLPVNPFFVPALGPYYTLGNNAVSLFYLLENGAVVVSLILRYRAAQTRERLQIKWFVWVTGVFVVLLSVFILITSLDPTNAVLGSPVLLILFYGSFSAIPAVGIGMAILRSRLWDIDIIIRRTLVYGTLTALLALLYVGLVFVMQSLLQGMFTQNNDLAIVVSTLAIAALFQPLHQRIQATIDHRFYRRKYDAAKTLAAFGATVRDEVDLDGLNKRLLAVVQETMQPAHVSLWLRPASHERKPDTPGSRARAHGLPASWNGEVYDGNERAKLPRPSRY